MTELNLDPVHVSIAGIQNCGICRVQRSIRSHNGKCEYIIHSMRINKYSCVSDQRRCVGLFIVRGKLPEFYFREDEQFGKY